MFRINQLDLKIDFIQTGRARLFLIWFLICLRRSKRYNQKEKTIRKQLRVEVGQAAPFFTYF